MSTIPTFTYVLDAIGVAGCMIGVAVAARSKYVTENSKEAAALIETLLKAKEVQAQEILALKSDRDKIHAELNKMQGKLESYKELQTVPADVISKLLETQNIILAAITKDNKMILENQNA